MKKNIILIFKFFLIVNLNAQTYKFDLGTTQELIGNGKVISQNYKLINSKNDTYTMLFYENGFASIFDRINLERHEFEVKSSENKKIDISYLRTCNEKDLYKRLIDINKENWNFRINKINDTIFELNEYKRKNAKKPTRRTVIKIKESPDNYMNLLHKIDDRLLNMLMDQLDKNKNYTIFEMSFYFNENKGKDSKLIDVKNLTDFEVILPEKLTENQPCVTHYFH